MRRRIETCLVLMAITTLGVAGLAATPRQEPSPDELREMMQRHAESALPGPEHERLAALAGTWEMEVTMWPEPGADPIQFPPSTVEARMILGGRFLQQHARGEIEGTITESVTLMGFDRRNGEYNLMGMDTTGTYWVTARGEAVDDRTVVLSGSDWDGIVGGEQIYDFVLIWEDEDTLVTRIIFKDEMHTRGGPPFQMVETRSRRLD